MLPLLLSLVDGGDLAAHRLEIAEGLEIRKRLAEWECRMLGKVLSFGNMGSMVLIRRSGPRPCPG